MTAKVGNFLVVRWSRWLRWWHSPSGVRRRRYHRDSGARAGGAKSGGATTKMGGSVAGDGGAVTRAMAWQSFGEWCSNVAEWGAAVWRIVLPTGPGK